MLRLCLFAFTNKQSLGKIDFTKVQCKSRKSALLNGPSAVCVKRSKSKELVLPHLQATGLHRI